MKVSDWIARFLAEKGIDSVFEMIGGMTTHLVDSIYCLGKTRIVTMHHEQAAAMAACGWARLRRLPGVALATSGPGAVNLLTGVCTAYFDSLPALFITGQVNQNELSTGLPVRQTGFQETDIVSMARPVTKGAWQAASPEEIPLLLNRAFDLSLEGRPGPVLIDLPMNLQRAEINDFLLPESAGEIRQYADSPQCEHFFRELETALSASSKPLILAGNGIHCSNTSEEISRCVRDSGIPAVWSFMGAGAVQGCGELEAGMIGTYGNRWANMALHEADLLIVLGSRLDIRQTGADIPRFMAGKTLFRIDIDAGELAGKTRGQFSLNADLSSVTDRLLRALLRHENSPDIADRNRIQKKRQAWRERIACWRSLWPDTEELTPCEGINPNVLMKMIGVMSGNTHGFVADAGAHQMWAAQSLRVGNGRFFLSSGGMAPMGFALPAGIGASIACGGPVVVLAGDGGIQCNIQEIQTVVRNKLPLKIIIFDNGSLGMVFHFQKSYFDGRCPGTFLGYDTPDFEAVGRAYGIESLVLEKESMAEYALHRLWKEPCKPFLLVVKVSRHTGVAPKMTFGKGLDQMDPQRNNPGGKE